MPSSSERGQAERPPYKDDDWTALLKAKYAQIDAIHGLATKRGTCLRAGIIRYFEKQQAKHRKTLGLRILERLFVNRTKPIVTKHCCDKYNAVSKDNYANWVKAFFEQFSQD